MSDKHCETCRCHAHRFAELLDYLDWLTYWRGIGDKPAPAWVPLGKSDFKLIVDEHRRILGREAYLEIVPKAKWLGGGSDE